MALGISPQRRGFAGGELFQVLEGNFEIVGQRTGERDLLTRERMRESKRTDVHGEPRDQRLFVGATFVTALQIREQQLGVVAVNRIVKNRRARGREVNADLMHASGERPALDLGKRGPAGGLRIFLPNAESRFARFAVFLDHAHHAGPGLVLLQDKIHRELIRCRDADHYRVIDFGDCLGLKLSANKIERDFRLSVEDESARVVIDAMDVGNPVAHFRPDQIGEIFPGMVLAIRPHEEAGRLVESQQGIIFKENGRERHGFQADTARPVFVRNPGLWRTRGSFPHLTKQDPPAPGIHPMHDLFSRLARSASAAVAHPAAFIMAALAVVIWAATGPALHYSEGWQLIINTGTTILTFLMIFLLQNMQNRDSRAMQVKLDELLRAVKGARTELVDLENVPEEELIRYCEEFKNLHLRYAKALAKRGSKIEVSTENTTVELPSNDRAKVRTKSKTKSGGAR